MDKLRGMEYPVRVVEARSLWLRRYYGRASAVPRLKA